MAEGKRPTGPTGPPAAAPAAGADPRRSIPSVDRLLADAAFDALLLRFPRARVVQTLRGEMVRVRTGDGRAPAGDLGDASAWAQTVEAALLSGEVPSLRPVVNATGVILHTNLGRAPLAPAALEAMVAAAGGYAALEYDLESGARGSRYAHCSELLTELTGAEAALVVNNNAAALVLALNTLALGKDVVVSRGELVEIGGSFRVPDILARSGARLVEVGSTNRTRIDDYRRGAGEATGAFLKVHRSNFRQVGFTEDTTLEALAALAAERGVPLLHDLGSGLLVDAARLGVGDEPTVAESLRGGADLITFSGDKLLGGPQAGVVLGRADLIARMQANPLCRALRVDKGTLAALEATLRLYRDPERALTEIPTLALLTLPLDRIEARARSLAESLRAAVQEAGATLEVRADASVVGGGTCPGIEVPTWAVALALPGVSAAELARRLRLGEPPVVARVQGERLVVDLRTVLAGEEEALEGALLTALRRSGEGPGTGA